ncbi:MAG TPA: EamA family transporter [Opitutaceae bacterium]|nr:EamA family transporter [Opitutaceae bacterium]
MSAGADPAGGPGVRATPSRGSLILAFAAIYLIWGSTYLGIRVAVETMPPFLMAGMRFAVAGVLIFTFLKLRGAAWPTAQQWRDQVLIGVFLLLGGNGLVSWAEQRTPSGITSLILGASPLIMVILDWVRPGGRRPTAILAAGVMVGIAGVALLVGPGGLPTGYRPHAADVAALFLASVSWWIGSLYSKHSRTGTPLMMASAMQMVSGSASMLLTGWMLGEGSRLGFAAVSPHSWLAFAYLVLVGSIIAYPVYVWLLEHSTPAKVSTYAYVNPVVAVFLGWAVLGEPMSLRIVVAAAIIIGAVAIITIGKTRNPAKT